MIKNLHEFDTEYWDNLIRPQQPSVPFSDQFSQQSANSLIDPERYQQYSNNPCTVTTRTIPSRTAPFCFAPKCLDCSFKVRCRNYKQD